MRCACLAEAWLDQRMGDVCLWGEVALEFVAKRLSGLAVEVLRARPPFDDSILVVDTYDQRIRQEVLQLPAPRLLVLVDDLGHWLPGYEVIWNPNAYPSEDLYHGFRGRLVTQRVPIRLGLPHWEPRSESVAVALGGGAQSSVLIRAINMWKERAHARIVAPAVAWTPPEWPSVTAEMMWTEFTTCARLLTGAGTTVWEAAAVGIPSCVVVTASNQVLIGRWATANGAPVIDATSCDSVPELAEQIAVGLSQATVLPGIENGTAEVADLLARLAA